MFFLSSSFSLSLFFFFSSPQHLNLMLTQIKILMLILLFFPWSSLSSRVGVTQVAALISGCSFFVGKSFPKLRMTECNGRSRFDSRNFNGPLFCVLVSSSLSLFLSHDSTHDHNSCLIYIWRLIFLILTLSLSLCLVVTYWWWWFLMIIWYCFHLFSPCVSLLLTNVTWLSSGKTYTTWNNRAYRLFIICHGVWCMVIIIIMIWLYYRWLHNRRPGIPMERGWSGSSY